MSWRTFAGVAHTIGWPEKPTRSLELCGEKYRVTDLGTGYTKHREQYLPW